MCRCFECGRYARNTRIVRTCAHTKMRSRTSSQVPGSITEATAFETGDHACGPLRDPERDARRVPADESRHDERDQSEDQICLTEVASLEPGRPLHLPDQERGDHADRHEDAEEVDEGEEPALVPEPRQGPVAVDGAEEGHDDRREEDDEAPEDQRRGRHRGRGAGRASSGPRRRPPRCVPGARPRRSGRRASPSERRDRRGAHAGRRACRRSPSRRPGRAPRGRCSRRRASGRGRTPGRWGLHPRAARIASERAGTTSCRSPITA